MSRKRNKKKQLTHYRKQGPQVRSPERVTFAGFTIKLDPEISLIPFVDASGLRAIARAHQLRGEVEQLRHSAAVKPPVETISTDVIATLVSVATNAWRARNKMIDAESREPLDEMRRVYRHIEGIFNSFDTLGFRIIDPVGEGYDSGMALKVISFEPTPGLSSERITETIKPSIIWQGRLLQTGEVIVGTPISINTTETEEHL